MSYARLLLLCSLAAALAAGCKTPEEGMIGEPPEDEEETQIRQGGPRNIELPGADEKREPTGEHPEPIFSVDGWPYNDEANTFSLEWTAQPAALPVHEAPSRNASIVGEYRVEPGQSIPWRNTRVNVFRPKIVETKRALTVEGFLWKPDSRALHRQPTDVSVGAGAPVAIYHYQGGNLCILGVADKLLEAVCPTPNAFAGDFRGNTRAETMQPEKRAWWVQITTNEVSGWIKLDDRVAVDIEKL